MAAPIQLIAPGLLGLLQLKQSGKNPTDLLETVQPIIEMRDWYMQARVEDEVSLFGGAPTVAFATATPGLAVFAVGATSCKIPANQVWYVTAMNVAINLLAAETIRYAAALQRDPTGQQFQVGPDVADTVTARARAISSWVPAPFWARSGDAFAILKFDVLTAGNITANLFLRAVRIQI